MYLLSKLCGSLTDLLSAINAGYPDGARHAAGAVLDVVHRLHQTRQPDCAMARASWLLAGEPLLPLCCRCMARMYKLREHVGLSGLGYDTEWLQAVLTQVVRYLDHHMGPAGDPGAGVPAPPKPGTEPPAGVQLCAREPAGGCHT